MTDHDGAQSTRVEGELRGALLSADENIDSAGGWVVILAVFIAIVAAVVLHLGWFDRLFGVDLSDLRHWYVYIVIVAAGFVVSALLCDPLERAAYRKHRRDIVNFANRAGLSRYQVIAEIEGVDELEHVAEWLKKDTSPDSWENRQDI